MAIPRGTTLDRLVAQVVGDAGKEDLFAVLRVFVLAHYRKNFGVPLLDVRDTAGVEEGALHRVPEM